MFQSSKILNIKLSENGDSNVYQWNGFIKNVMSKLKLQDKLPSKCMVWILCNNLASVINMGNIKNVEIDVRQPSSASVPVIVGEYCWPTVWRKSIASKMLGFGGKGNTNMISMIDFL